MKKKQNKAFRKLKRLELVELIYELRKRNVELEKEVQHLKDQLDESEELRRQYAANQPNEETASKIEALVAEMVAECRTLREQLEQHRSGSAD